MAKEIRIAWFPCGTEHKAGPLQSTSGLCLRRQYDADGEGESNLDCILNVE